MKRMLTFLMVLVLCALPLAGCKDEGSTPANTPAAPEEQLYSQDVDITNSTGVDILELYISQSDVDEWEEDLLAGRVFAAGATMEFTTDTLGTADATWDLLAIDEDGDEIVYMDINLSSAVGLVLHWGADGQTPSVRVINSGEEQYYSQDLDITNGTGVDILEVYISTSDDNSWGPDLLGDDIFEAGETLLFTTELLGDEYTTWDIRIIDEDGDEVIFEDIDFSSATELTLTWGEDGRTPTVIPTPA